MSVHGTPDHRGLRVDARFEAERDEISNDIERWDEIFRGVEWALCSRPDKAGVPTGQDGIWALTTLPWPHAPAVVIYYTFDHSEVTLKSIRPAAPDPDRE